MTVFTATQLKKHDILLSKIVRSSMHYQDKLGEVNVIP